MSVELKPCPKYKKDFFRCRCHLIFFTTAEKPPKNIRVSCETHGYTLDGSYESVEEAGAAWNRRAET